MLYSNYMKFSALNLTPNLLEYTLSNDNVKSFAIEYKFANLINKMNLVSGTSSWPQVFRRDRNSVYRTIPMIQVAKYGIEERSLGQDSQCPVGRAYPPKSQCCTYIVDRKTFQQWRNYARIKVIWTALSVLPSGGSPLFAFYPCAALHCIIFRRKCKRAAFCLLGLLHTERSSA